MKLTEAYGQNAVEKTKKPEKVLTPTENIMSAVFGFLILLGIIAKIVKWLAT